MQLVVNGEEREVGNTQTLQELLSFYKLDNKILVIELNRNIIDRDKYADTKLSQGDRVEIVHFVGGG